MASAGALAWGGLLEALFVLDLSRLPLRPQLADVGFAIAALGMAGAAAGGTAAAVVIMATGTGGARAATTLRDAAGVAATLIACAFGLRWARNVWAVLGGAAGSLSAELILAAIVVPAAAAAVLLGRRAWRIGALFGLAASRAGLAAAAAGLVVTVGWGDFNPAVRSGDASRPNILLVVFDGMRASNTSVYGYRRRTTPALEELAAQGLVFERMHSNADGTLSAVRSLLSGRLPFAHGAVFSHAPGYDPDKSLPGLLARQGYAVAAATSAAHATLQLAVGPLPLAAPERSWWTGRTLQGRLGIPGPTETSAGARFAFDLLKPAVWLRLLAPEPISPFVVPAEQTFARAAALVRELPQPFFLFVHVLEPHPPFHALPPFRGRYLTGRVREAALDPWTARIDLHLDMYDESIAFVDAEFGRLVKLVEAISQAPPLVVATADHGLAFAGEVDGAGVPLSEAWTRVPLVVRVPHGPAGVRLDVPAESADVAPTVLDALGLPVEPWMDGQSLLKARADRATMAFTVVKPRQEPAVAIWFSAFKGVFGCTASSSRLYDLSDDPGERRDLAPVRPDIADLLRKRVIAAIGREKLRSLGCEL